MEGDLLAEELALLRVLVSRIRNVQLVEDGLGGLEEGAVAHLELAAPLLDALRVAPDGGALVVRLAEDLACLLLGLADDLGGLLAGGLLLIRGVLLGADERAAEEVLHLADATDLGLHVLDLIAQVDALLPEFLIGVDDLLEHVVNLLRLADRVAPLYPAIDRDLLLIGVLFHDLGKTLELESENGFSYTDAGQLLGHVLLGLEQLEAKIVAIEARTGRPFDVDLAVRIKHMVASHHGQYEYGAPKLPMTLEALALHHLDHMDARLAGVLQLLQNEAAIDGGWTQYQQSLGRKFFRGRGS